MKKSKRSLKELLSILALCCLTLSAFAQTENTYLKVEKINNQGKHRITVNQPDKMYYAQLYYIEPSLGRWEVKRLEINKSKIGYIIDQELIFAEGNLTMNYSAFNGKYDIDETVRLTVKYSDEIMSSTETSIMQANHETSTNSLPLQKEPSQVLFQFDYEEGGDPWFSVAHEYADFGDELPQYRILINNKLITPTESFIGTKHTCFKYNRKDLYKGNNYVRLDIIYPNGYIFSKCYKEYCGLSDARGKFGETLKEAFSSVLLRKGEVYIFMPDAILTRGVNEVRLEFNNEVYYVKPTGYRQIFSKSDYKVNKEKIEVRVYYFMNDGSVLYGKEDMYNLDYPYTSGQLASSSSTVNSISQSLTTSTIPIHTSQMYALVIGVEDYKSVYVNDLHYTNDDVDEVYQHLRSSRGGEVNQSNIVLLKEKDATRANILAKLKEIVSKAQSNDVIVLYFSGHGDRGSIVPYDYDPLDFNNFTEVKYTEMMEILNQSKAKHRIAMIDACYSGSIVDSNNELLTYRKRTLSADKLYEINAEIQVRTFTTLASSEPWNTSIESGRFQNGQFTYYLIQGMKGSADSNKDGAITTYELFKYIESQSVGHKPKFYALNDDSKRVVLSVYK